MADASRDCEIPGHCLARIHSSGFGLRHLAGWALPALLALFSLRGRGLTGVTQAVWVLIIVAVPFLGALAYFIMRPGDGQLPHT